MVANHSEDPRFLENPFICFPWNYDENLGDGSTLQWVIDTFSPNVEPEYRNLLAPVIRVLCTGYAIRTGLIFTFWGDRGTGKSTLAEIIKHTIGLDNVANYGGNEYVDWEEKTFTRYGAKDAHIVHFDEPKVTGKEVDPQYIKRTSGQPVPYYNVMLEGKKLNLIPYQVFYSYLITTNKLPFKSASCLKSVARRLLLIKFRQSPNMKVNDKLLGRFISEQMGQRLIMDCIKADLDSDVKYLIDYAQEHNQNNIKQLRDENDCLAHCFYDCFEIATEEDFLPNFTLTQKVNAYMEFETNRPVKISIESIREAFIEYIEEAGIIYSKELKLKVKKMSGKTQRGLFYLKNKTD